MNVEREMKLVAVAKFYVAIHRVCRHKTDEARRLGGTECAAERQVGLDGVRLWR